MELIVTLRGIYDFAVMLLYQYFHFFVYKFQTSSENRNEIDISGKCVIVTGGSSGIGKSSAKEFAKRGAIVVIGDKNVEMGQKSVNEIRSDTGNVNVTILKLDLSDMDSVEKFAKKVSTDHPKIKILLNNAGIGASDSKNIKTKDGFNIHVAINYMGHFLLTNLLMDNLKAESNSRIVSLTSTCMLASKLNIDDLNMDNTNFGFLNSLPYNNTKCMLALYTKELGKQLGVNAYAVCPAIVNTQIFNDCPWLFRLSIRMSRLFSFTPDEAASNFIMYCALDESLANESGKTYQYGKLFHKANKLLDLHSETHLFNTSATLVGLEERMARAKK